MAKKPKFLPLVTRETIETLLRQLEREGPKFAVKMMKRMQRGKPLPGLHCLQQTSLEYPHKESSKPIPRHGLYPGVCRSRTPGRSRLDETKPQV